MNPARFLRLPAAAVALLGTGLAAAQEAPSSIIVSKSTSLTPSALQKLRTSLGVEDVRQVDSLNAEIWQLGSQAAAAKAIKAAPGKLGADYVGADYRALFLPVPADLKLSTAQQSALSSLKTDPKYRDVNVVRLRVGDASARLLTSGLTPADGLPATGSLIVNLTPFQSVIATKRTLTAKTSSNFQWLGDIQAALPALPAAASQGAAAFAVRGDKILGTVSVGFDTYSILPLGDGVHAIAKVNVNAVPPDHPPETPAQAATAPALPPAAVPALPPAAVPASPPAVATADAPVVTPEITIGIAYTASALRYMKAHLIDPALLADYAINATNGSFVASDVRATVKLAGVKEAGHDELGSMVADLAALLTAQGRFADLHRWRRQTHANAVTLLVANAEGCGLSSGVLTTAPQAYSVVSVTCVQNNYSVAHELGHLLGARHDQDNDDTPFAFGHGYVYSDQFRTIMAYPDACNNCPRLNLWANPNKTLNGVALGTEAHNYDARALNQTVALFSRYAEP